VSGKQSAELFSHTKTPRKPELSFGLFLLALNLRVKWVIAFNQYCSDLPDEPNYRT